MMGIKAVLFDLDDTLWPTMQVIQHAESTLFLWMQQHVPQIAQEYSIEKMRAYRQALISTDPRFQYDLWALRHALLSKLFQEFGEDQVKADQAMAVFAEARNQVDLFPDVLPGLEQLRARTRLGSISNGFADLKTIGLAPYFEVSIAAHVFGCAKPDPRIFAAACEGLQLAPQQVAFVGDDLLLDVEGAQKAGLRGVWMNRAGLKTDQTTAPHVQPDAIVTGLQGLLDWL